MAVKDHLRPLLGVRELSMLRRQIAFRSSASYWERRYARGGSSGEGSYGSFGEAKSAFLNSFVRENAVDSVIEFGCGDGHQLSMAEYPRYVGLDVSRTAIGMCKSRFPADKTKSFFLYDHTCFIDHAGLLTADLAISLDVIYHLVEDCVFEAYMNHLFAAGQRFVIVYSTNADGERTVHVRHRCFTTWVEAHRPHWRLMQTIQGPNPGPVRADFFVYQRCAGP
jgi:SAM-dependent methyltransferase